MNFLKKILAGIMIVPMLLATCINTVAPDFLKMGGMFSALFPSGSLATLSAAIFFCCGLSAGRNVRKILWQRRFSRNLCTGIT